MQSRRKGLTDLKCYRSLNLERATRMMSNSTTSLRQKIKEACDPRRRSRVQFVSRLVGQLSEVIADYAIQAPAPLPQNNSMDGR
ncbi:MAG: hypothetical protein ABI284_05240 [Nitrosospira sp.]